MSRNNTSQAKSYINIFKKANHNKGNDHSIVIIIIMINVVSYIDKKEDIRVNIVRRMTITKIMRMARGMRTIRMIMKMIKTMTLTEMKRFIKIIIIRIIRIVRVITIIIRMRISVMTVEI